MVFDINQYSEGNYVMHCRTIIEAKSFCAYLHSIGREWSNGNSYLNNDRWYSYEEDTCYEFNHSCYNPKNYYTDREFTILEWKDFMYDTPLGSVDDINIYDPNIITIAGTDFIVFPEENGIVPIVAKKSVFEMQIDIHTNNFANSYCLRQLNSVILPAIEEALGAENVLEFETDLTALDGRTDYGTMLSRISLPTIDFYKANIQIFDKYSSRINWFLATPWSTPSVGYKTRQVLVTYRKRLYDASSGDFFHIRPILYVKAEALTTQN